MKKLSIITVLLLVVSAVFGQTKDDLQFIEQTLENRGEIVLRFPHNGNRELVNELGHIISIDKITDAYVEAYANAREYEQFKTYGIEYEPVYEYYRQTRALNMATSVAQMANWDRYPTYAVYLEMMHNYATNYPTLCKMDTIGYSVNNRPIITMVISDNIGTNEDEPEFWWSSTMHGDETTGWYFMIRLVDYLLTNYGTDAQVTNLVNNMEIYISPLTNPDGTFSGSSNGTSIANATRTNANGTDLNRSFPDINGYAGTSDPEVTMVKNYAAAHHFVMAANGHGGTECINYPWDEQNWTSSTHPHPDDNWWQYVCFQYADTCHAINSRYFKGPGSSYNNTTGVTEGCDWYYTEGGRQDYMNYFHHCRELTLEWSNEKTLGTENLNTYWGYNRKAILNFTEQALYGFRGIVTDACTNQPLSGVKVFINNHDADNSEVYSAAPVGDYHRPIYAGTYSVTFSKDGYVSKTFTVTTQNMASVRLDVSLCPEPSFTTNPPVAYEGRSIQFNNTLEACTTSTSWTFEGASPATSTAASPTVIYNVPGTYNVSLSTVSDNGCSSSTTGQITVYEAIPPEADFSASETIVSIGNAVDFTDLSTNMPTSWQWTFEGGNPATSNEQNPTVTYEEPGIYSVTLVATNDFGSDTETKTAYIEVVSVIDMSNDPIYACTGTYRDPGGDGNYGNNARYTQTIYPSNEGAYVRLTFTQLELQQTTYWNTTTCNDYITIYDGTSTSATQIGQYCGTNPAEIGTNGVVTATNDDGALTIYFYSNNRTTNTGWEAEISCYLPEPEVAVQSYTPTMARYNTTNDLSVTFVNNGVASTSASTSATLSTTDDYITLNTATANIGVLSHNATATETFSFTVAENVPDGHVATINVEIVDGNRTWNETLTITAIGPSCEPPTGLQVALNGTTATITWDTQATSQFTINDDFEGHTNGTINSPGTVGWTYIDGDNTNTNQFSSISFTNEGSKMAFIVLDDEELTGSSANVNAHSGDKFIGAPYVSQNDDWIISPELNFSDDFTFSFFARSYSYNYTNEQFYAAYSTTGNSASDFTNLNEITTTTTTWTEYSYTVPANAKYVAIHCVSRDVYMFCVDDISISGNVVSDVVVNLYDNGALVASNVTGGTYTANDLSAGEHCFSIRAVCSDDSESLAAQSCVNVENIAPTPTYTITVNAGNGGSVSPNGTQTVNEGENFTFTVVPDNCYEVASVTVNGTPVTPTNNIYTISNVTEPQSINATLSLISYTITASAGNGGTISNAGSTTVNCGEDITYTITPDEGYMISDVLVDGQSIGSVSSYPFTNVVSDHTISATFELIPAGEVVIVVNADAEGGSVNPTGTQTITEGDDFPFTVTPDNCYEIGIVTVNGNAITLDENNSYTIENVSEPQNINVTFNRLSYIITASASEGGSITPSGDVEVNCGESKTFAIAANEGYEIENVVVDGQSQGAITSYTFENVTEAGHSIEAIFNEIIVVPECNAVTNLTAQVESYGVVLSWNAAENALSYDIYRNGERIATETNISAIDLQGHEGDTYYIITNCANGGTSDASETITATAEPTCNAITNLTARVESYGIVLSWEAAENAVSYDIYCNGNRISTASATSYIDLQGHEGDTYYIITNCANGGTSDASESTTAIVTGISEVENNIAIFPNPANDILNITSSETISEIEIVNTLGQVVYRVEVNSDNAVCDVNGLASGVYVVKIHTLQRTEPVEASLSKGTAIVQKKFVKE
jgi:PKD repeat protein